MQSGSGQLLRERAARQEGFTDIPCTRLTDLYTLHLSKSNIRRIHRLLGAGEKSGKCRLPRSVLCRSDVGSFTVRAA